MTKKDAILQCIIDQGMLPLFYYQDADVSLEIIRTLYKAGVRVLEYTNRGKCALNNFRILKEKISSEMPDLYLGIGTIKNGEEAATFIDADADFLVSPIVTRDVADTANLQNILWIPGCMTPTEIYKAQLNKAPLIKIFPANILGPEFISSIKELFRGQLFIPTGGVDVERENLTAWFKSGVCSVGMGSKLISKSVLENRDYEALYKKTVEALAMIEECRGVNAKA